MARPTKPKDLKPKAEAEVAAVPGPSGSGDAAPAIDIKMIVLLIGVVLGSVLGSVGGIYALGEFVFKPDILAAIHKSGAGAAGEDSDAVEGEDPHAVPAVGMNLELDEFMVNLKVDPTVGGNQYLRAKMALSVQVPTEEDCYHVAAQAIPVAGGQVVGAAAPVDQKMLASGGGGEGGPGACETLFKQNMSKYVPTIRDVINAALMKRTAGTLASLEGQEALKDEIKDQLSQIMGPKYQVIRVNFEDFIVQR